MPAKAVALKPPLSGSLRGLDWLNFFLADVQTGVGPFLAIYLAAYHWDEQQVGTVLAIGGIAGILAQTPAGALVDKLHAKRALIGGAAIALAGGALLTAFLPTFWPIASAQVLIGAASSLFGPAIAAISLGIVGPRLFDRRQGRNQTFNAAGNVFAAISMGLIAYAISDRSIFFFVVAFVLPTLVALRCIHSKDIDYQQARGGKEGDDAKTARLADLLNDGPLVIFLICAVLFHFANAAILPLLGEMLAKGHGRSSMLFMAACIVTTQLTVSLISSFSGSLAGTWGRKPLLLIGFAALPIRAVLYTLTDNTVLLIAIQVLDGVAAGIFGVVSVLVIADLTRGSGRFNLTLGAIATAVGIGASISQVIAGAIVHHFSYRAGFLFCAVIHAIAFGLLLTAMPETGSPSGDNKFAHHPSA
jgi:MFS family permease